MAGRASAGTGKSFVSDLRLDYVALAANDVAALDRLLVEVLGLPRRQVQLGAQAVPTIDLGDVALLLFERGDPHLEGDASAGVHHLGFAADEFEAVAAHTGIAHAEMGDDAVGARQLRFPQSNTGGVRMRIGSAIANRDPGRSERAERIDHIGVASTSNRDAEALFASKLGFSVESRQTDMETHTAIESFTSDRYGVVQHARTPQAVGGLRVSFITVGDCDLEFLEEFDPQAMSASRQARLGASPGTTRQDQGAIGRFIERRGAGLHHLAIKTPDINATLQTLIDAGIRTIDAVGRPGSRRAHIGFIHPSASGGVLMHFVERDPID